MTRPGAPRTWPVGRPWLVAGLGLLALLAVVAAFSTSAQAVDPPFATIAAPANNSAFEAGTVVVFSANGSTDPDGAPGLNFTWDFPNETVGAGGAFWIYYPNFTVPGTYVVRLTVRDNESLEGYANVTVVITPPNNPPVAFIASPSGGSKYYTDQFINFSATGSTDPEDGPLTYFWSTNISGQFGTAENLSVRLVAGCHLVTLRAVDDHGAGDTATLQVCVEANVPPHVAAAPVSPASGFEGDTFAFEADYTEENGESAARVLLVLDGTPYPMQLTAGADPRAGQRYGLSLTPTPGRHAFYVLADDGNFTNITALLQGPDIWQNVSILSSDLRASLTLAVLPPSNLSLVRWAGALPGDPAGLVPVSPGYLLNGSAADASNFTMTIAYQPDATVNASSARAHRVQGSGWLALVTLLDGAAHVGTVTGSPVEIPATYRIFAARATPPQNEPPALEIKFGGDLFPNATVTFDAGNSSDPEGATLLLAWNFSGAFGSTGWLPGRSVALAFPAVGLYTVSLRAEDGSGNVAFKNITLEVRDRPVRPTGSLEEPMTLAALAAAVGLSALLAVWWRGRAAPRKKKYEDLYGRLYKERFAEDTEYTQLFEKYAEPAGPEEPQAPGLKPPEIDEP